MNSINVHSRTLGFNNDLLTPIAAYLKLNQTDAFFLESVEKGQAIGRYSMIGLDPLCRVQGYQDYISLTINNTKTVHEGHPLNKLNELYKSINHSQSGETPVSMGFFGYFSWEVIQVIEQLDVQQKDSCLFDFQIPTLLVVFDHANQMIFITHSSHEPITSDAYIHQIFEQLQTSLSDSKYRPISKPSQLDWSDVSSNWSQADYQNAVLKAKDHIKEGDIFQAVLSQRFTVPKTKDSLSVYRSLRHINPSPYMFYFNYGDTKIIGSSPEILVKSEAGVATVRPIAGTRKRTGSNEDDLIEDLKTDEKEVAEHIMLVDLGRNDLGRVCDYKSIEINDLMTIERYSHVLHMVTNVTGTLKENMTPIDLFKATFPAGTVSGAPKIRAIEIINQLEPDARHIYSGSVGYFNFSGIVIFALQYVP